MFLQPKYRIHDNTLAGAEALVRWVERDGTIIYPGDFIPIFEQNGFVVKLDMYMLENVCKILDSWIERGLWLVPISVNFSPLHLLDNGFVEKIESISEKHEVPRRYIEIELTESTVIDNEEVLEVILSKLHDKGFTLSMDDFGSGYSSLGLLKNFEVDTIKMDRSFFTGGKDLHRGNVVVESVTNMAHRLNISIVAEGVETAEQVEFLKETKCDIVQGYYYAKPMSVDDFERHCFGDK